MINNSWFDQGFSKSPYMAILRGFGWPKTAEIAETAWSTGVELIEVPVQSETDLEVLRKLAAIGEKNGLAVGAGTVLSADHVEIVAQAGARFIVAPDTNPEVIIRASELGLAALPGVGTATDVAVAMDLGLNWLKVFPAAVLGSQWIKQMLGPFPAAKFVATGGMDLSNAEEFLQAGAMAVSLGSAVEQLGSIVRES